MVARVRTHGSNLLVTFESDGEESEQCLAATGQQALEIALSMLARRVALRHGDRLTIVEVGE
jgi:hypothetical protein